MHGRSSSVSASAVFSFVLAVTLAWPVRAANPTSKAPRAPHAELRWDEEHPRFRPIEYVATGALGPLAIAEYFTLAPQAQPHWVGGILFDDAARDALRIRSPSALRASWAAADGIGVSLVALSVGLDSLVVPLLRGSPDVAWQLLVMDAESFTFDSLVAITLYDTIGRARPSYTDCQLPNAPPGCGVSPTASFPSGHVAEAYTAAGLSCAHHLFAHVYGSRAADAFACVRDVTLATTEGLLRVMGDRHYMSDVLVGGAIGFAFGFGLPTLLHYVKWRRPLGGAIANVSLAPMLGPQVGIVAAGMF